MSWDKHINTKLNDANVFLIRVPANMDTANYSYWKKNASMFYILPKRFLNKLYLSIFILGNKTSYFPCETFSAAINHKHYQRYRCHGNI